MNNIIIQSYPLSIYPYELFLTAIKDYRAICRISAVKKRYATVCTFQDSSVDLALTAKEFSNYLIELAMAGSRNHDT